MKETTVREALARALAPIWAAFVAGTLIPLSAQETLAPLTPAGRLRLGVTPVYHFWSSRFGTGPAEPLGADLTDPTGARLFPAVASLEERLRDLLADPAYEARLGTSRAEVSASRIRVPLSVELGLFDWLSAGVTVPLVQNRTEVEFAFRADSATANLGLSPAISRAQEVLAFSDELGRRLGAAAARASTVCGADPSSAACSSARQLAQDGDRLVSGLRSAYAASPFFPLASSPAAAALRSRLEAFNQRLVDQGLSPVVRMPLFATARLSASDLELLLSDAAVGINAPPLHNRVGLWQLGDVEVHVALRLLEGSGRSTPEGPARWSYQIGAGALLRLGTGAGDDPNVFLDLPAGDGQSDVEARAFAHVRSGRAGFWGNVRYGVQRPRTLLRRVGPPEVVFVPAVNLADVKWSPGDYLDLELVPRYHFTDELSLVAAYRFFRKQEDAFSRVSPPRDPPATPPLPSPLVFRDVGLLASGSGETLHEAGAGLFLSTVQASSQGRASVPLEAHLGVKWAVAGSGSASPKGVRANVGLRLFFRLWGD
jgi:hypothetical protein